MTKQQLGVRVDRLLMQQLRANCKNEKLRPGEAVEALIAASIKAGGVGRLTVNVASETEASRVETMEFKSKMVELRGSLENDAKCLDELGEKTGWSTSHNEAQRLVELARKIHDPQLLDELDVLLKESDRVHTQSQKLSTEKWVKDRKAVG